MTATLISKPPSGEIVQPRAEPGALHYLLFAGTVGVIAWGALAFGAVYEWAYIPLAAAAAAIGILGLFAGTVRRPPLGNLAIGLGAIAGAIALQLVPVKLSSLAALSPAADAFLRNTNLTYQLERHSHPLSIAPHETLVGLMLFAALALFLLGVSRLVSVVGARPFAYAIVGAGGLLAVIGIAQYALTLGETQPLIYGYWKPLSESHPFGPFVNPNHFAGWMAMALPLTLAVFFDALLGTMRSAPAGRGGRIDLVSSPQFGGLVAIGAINLVMALSLIMTRSRSALAAFTIGALLAGWTVARHQRTKMAKTAVATSAVLLVLGAGLWAGTDALVTKFTENQSTKSFEARLSAWRDATTIIVDFPWTGVGLDGYGTAMLEYQTNHTLPHFAEAHNEYLQLAAEGGLLVCIPIVATLVVFVSGVRRRFREAPKDGTTYWLRVGAVIGILCIALQSLVEFSLQMPGNAVLFALLAGIAIHRSPHLIARRAAVDAS